MNTIEHNRRKSELPLEGNACHYKVIIPCSFVFTIPLFNWLSQDGDDAISGYARRQVLVALRIDEILEAACECGGTYARKVEVATLYNDDRPLTLRVLVGVEIPKFRGR